MNIWMVGLGAAAYVHAGASRSTWVEHIEADPRVRLRVNDSIYELEAARGAEVAEGNNELFVFRHENGAWKIHRYLFSTNRPRS